MKTKTTFYLILLCLAATGSIARADVVSDWNQAALNAIRAHGTPPPAASRNLAMLHAAIYDAVNGITRTHEPYHVPSSVPASASGEVAASAAAHHVMSTLYPAQQAGHDRLHQSILARWPDRPQKEMGRRWGETVAVAILDLRRNDGSSVTAPFPGSLEPGQWRPHESFGGVVRPALLPLWGYVTPFALASGTQFRPPAPPALASAEYAEEVNFVKTFGSIHSTARAPDETEIALFWAYGPGTATPPGHWNQIATVVSSTVGLRLEESARLFALLNLALADAAIVSWDCKYQFNLWRPISAIQLADTDLNPATDPDPAWKPLLFTPPFPEYVSGHSTFSGAGATVLAGFFGRNDLAFEAPSDDLPGVTRHFSSFSHAAEESGMSRIWGGIHYMSGNRVGLHMGAEVGGFVLDHYLRPKSNRSRQ